MIAPETLSNALRHRKIFISLVCVGLLLGLLAELPAQEQQEPPMRVAETDDEGRAIRFDFNFTGQELKGLLEWLSRETELTIIASEEDLRDKRFSLINLKNVTLDQVIERIKTILAQYNLTLIRTDSTLLITTFEKAMVMKVPFNHIFADPAQVEETDEIQTYVVQLENAVASEQVEALRPLLNKQAVIFAEATTNALVITDVASNIRRIVSILQIADEGERFPLRIAIIPLTYADATELAQMLTRVFQEEEDEQKTSGGKRIGDADDARLAIEQGTDFEMFQGTVQIYADANSNSLVVKASEANLVLLRELIRQLDISPTLRTEIRIFRLKNATAEDVASVLQEVITGESSRNTGRTDPWDRAKIRAFQREQGVENQGIVGDVRVSRDDRLNVVVVASDPRNFSIIDKVINALDQEQTQTEIKIYYLKYAIADTLAPSLQDLFEGGSAGADRERPWWARARREPSGSTGFGIQGEVHIVPDARLNALMVSTSAQNFEVIDDLLSKVDVAMPDQEWGTEIFKLQYADAENIANIINNTYQGGSGDSGNFFFFLAERQRNQTQGSLAGNVTAEPYITLNAVIISTSTQRNFDLITQFIKDLDVPTPQGQKEVTETIRLEYANAEELEDVLEDVWEGDDSQNRFSFSRFFATGGRMEQKDINSLRGKVTVHADEDTNTLVVTTLQRYLPDVRALIAKLDFVRGQVWIDIRILEVTLDDTTKLGIELTVEENRIFGIEPRRGNPLVGELTPELALEREVSGFNISLATNEYMALLHAMIRENKVRTLSTPSLLTRDSQPATWSSGRRIPYLQSVDTNSILGEGVSQPLFNYDFIDPPVGINIDITPYIAKSQASEDGTRTIGLDIANISASNFVEFTDFNAPITEDNSISSYIDVEDGQQIVVGGIIRQKQTNVEVKLPILGDIPLIGRFFKKTDSKIENAEIVIIITPHIVDIKNPGDLEKLKEKADNWQNNGMELIEPKGTTEEEE